MEIIEIGGLIGDVDPPTRKIRLILKTFVHSLLLIHNVSCTIYGITLMPTWRSHKDERVRDLALYVAGYGTNWNFTFQTLFLLIAVVNDILEWTKKSESKYGIKLKHWNDIIFGGLVFPVTLFVSAMFWTLYAIDRELVYPTVFDEVVPWWFNHCVHTNILLVVAMETMLQPRRHPANVLIETILVWAVNFGYALVYYCIYWFANRWLYDVFAIMTWWQLILYQILIWTSSFFFYLIQYPISRLIHGEEDNENASEPENETKRIDSIDRSVNKNGDLTKRKVKDSNLDSKVKGFVADKDMNSSNKTR